MSSAFEGLPKTPNLKLNKPGYDNVADIEALNENADILDEEIQGIKNTFVKSVNGKEPDAAGNVNVEEYTHPNSGVTAGTYRSVTVNAQGHVTAGSNPTLAIANGGTGATTAANARTNLGLGNVATLNTVPIANGGTGATSESIARQNLGTNIKTYYSLSQLGLSNAATEIEIAKALPSNSFIYFGGSNSIYTGLFATQQLSINYFRMKIYNMGGSYMIDLQDSIGSLRYTTSFNSSSTSITYYQIATWFAPDYNSPVTISENTSNIMSNDGYLITMAHRQADNIGYIRLTINSFTIEIDSNSYSYDYMLFPVRKGDVISYVTNGLTSYYVKFFKAR